MNLRITWTPEKTPASLHAALRTLAADYPIHETAGGATPDGLAVEFVPGPTERCVSRRTGQTVTIAGGARPAMLRAVGAALAGRPAAGGEIVEACPFESFGIMLDCSRNAVMRVDHLKLWLRRLALLGYNQAMLYTEDTYEIPGEPRFGFHRGRYTQAELRELDVYAASLGVELVGCIQTLAHLEQILRWGEYQAVKDYDSVLLVGEPKTYELIGRMLDAMAGALRSRRIHIGMDEAWALGRGAYLDRHGARRKFDIFNEHLERVVALCRQRGLQPMIWSDMFFAMGSPTHGYYDPGVIPPDVVASIPADVQLVYWDYYHRDPAFYRDYIARHRALGHEPPMASGVWTWSQLWYNRKLTEANAGACLEACRAEGLKELFFTLWGDDGACCDFDSALAGLAWAAERAYAPERADEVLLATRFAAVCGGADYAAVTQACELTDNCSAAILWDDPILGIFANEGLAPAHHPPWTDVRDGYARLAETLAPFGKQNQAGDLDHARMQADVLARKMDIRHRLVAGYEARDPQALGTVATDATALATAFGDLEESWRRGWMRRNKPQGFEVIQLRLAQQAARHRELARRIDELLAGTVDAIPELDERPTEAKGMGGGWRFLASGSVSI